ncbi:MAG: TonB-dependent receptor domain-containing protein [Vulcanimicrobiaceae bacterium]
MLLVAFLLQGTWALAGTTGGLGGSVTDESGKPIANVKITASSASQMATTQSDASGHFVFLALAPDTYTLSAEKDGYTPASLGGATVFADNVQSYQIQMHLSLKTIAVVRSQAASSLVKSGVGGDIYNVTPGQMQKTGALGGGGNLDSAYSAIASVPGVTVSSGGTGWNQNVFIRGSQSFFSGFEYDGIPVNRAFDNYNTSTESNLGLQELQVYTGGGPAANSSSGTSGFINQVIKTGTYPGTGSLSFGASAPQFYHQARVEAGGATPNRNFSYYVGLSGYNQDFRYFDNNNGAGLFTPNGTFGYVPAYTSADDLGAQSARGILPTCDANLNTPSAMTNLPWYAGDLGAGAGTPGGTNTCFVYDPAAALFGQYATIQDREDVVNFHFGLPRKNGQRDDVQLLWSASAMNTSLYSSVNDAGGPALFTQAVTGQPYDPANNYPSYVDATVYNLPFGTPIAGHNTITYYQPSSPTDRDMFAALPDTNRDAFRNDTGITKVQWTHPLSSSAYVRFYGYTFFSDWTQAGANDSWAGYENGIGGPADYGVAANYDLITHTNGGEFQFVDQLNTQHLLEFTANYAQASVSRFNNTGWLSTHSPIGYVSESNGVYQCWDPSTGNSSSCLPGSAYSSNSVKGPTGTASDGSSADLAGAQWVSLWNGDTAGTYNTVKPKFSFISLSDQWRPSAKLLFNLGLRYEDYIYGLAPPSPGTDFYAQIVSGYVCQNAVGTILTSNLKPGQAPPAPVIYTANCPSGYSHPAFSAQSPSQYTISDWSPRFSMTYTQSPYTVLRASIGRYTEPPISASLQYLNSSGNALSIWNATLPLGFNSPFHPIPAMSATQADLSLEHQIRGTDMSFKLSPFLNLTQGYQTQSAIGPNFVTQAPVGQFRSSGLEGAFTKGDFNRNGLSGQLSLTYTDAKVQYQSKYYGVNQIDPTNADIAQFNTLTKGGGGSPCYSEAPIDPVTKKLISAGAGEACTTPGAVTNPYYNMAVQPLLDPNGWYPTGYDSPWVGALVLNYRHDKFTITPSFQFMQGSSYGGATDVVGLDPRACALNSADAGITAASPNTDPNQCDYLSLKAANLSPDAASGQLFIPNPQTGYFAKPGQFRDPNIFLVNLQMSYEVSPKVTAQFTLADLYHTCFGGSKTPWTTAYSPGRNVCGYGANGLYASNFYNGTGYNDTAANGVTPYSWQTQSYVPSFAGSAGSGVPFPFNAYFSLQIKL